MTLYGHDDDDYRARLNGGKLTKQELRLLQLAADGLVYHQIAEEMNIKPGYVKHVSLRAQIKLGADNRTHAVAQALRKGLIS
jgi:DNA-binding NarL/FixJ family response regulator